MGEPPFGPGHRLNDAANAVRRKAWRALRDGTSLRLTYEEVEALHCMEGDGNWWQDGMISPTIDEGGKG